MACRATCAVAPATTTSSGRSARWSPSGTRDERSTRPPAQVDRRPDQTRRGSAPADRPRRVRRRPRDPRRPARRVPPQRPRPRPHRPRRHRGGARFRFHRKTPVAIENRAYVAEYDRGRRHLTLTSSTQIPGIVRDLLSELLDMPGHAIRVMAPDVGGGFGGKGSLYMEELLVAVLARKLGRPVRWTSDRLEDLLTTSQSFDEIVDAELGLDADGNILALSADVIGDICAYSIYPWTAALEPVQVVSFLPGPYRIANYRGRVRGVATSKAPMGPYRGVGRPIATFVTERLIDMAARALDHDSLEFRRKNLVRADELPYKAASGLVWDNPSFIACLDAAAEAADYRALRAEQQAARAAGRWVGIGIASYAELTGIGSRISAAPGMPINTRTQRATLKPHSTRALPPSVGT